MQQKKIEHLEMLTSARQANLFALTVSDPLSRVLQAGFMDRFCEHGLRRHDRIMLTASALAPEAEFAWLVVESNEKGIVKAKVLP